MRILTISGSLRKGASNTTLLRAIGTLAPEGVQVTLYDGLADLPAFNPDSEGAEPPPVLDFRAKLKEADGLIISSPEYAHGVPGSLKNALDWIVGSGELVDKPVALLNASPMATYAQASLMETITVMSARVITDASLTIPIQGKHLDEAGIAADPLLSGLVLKAVNALIAAIDNSAPRTDSAVQHGTKDLKR